MWAYIEAKPSMTINRMTRKERMSIAIWKRHSTYLPRVTRHGKVRGGHATCHPPREVRGGHTTCHPPREVRGGHATCHPPREGEWGWGTHVANFWLRTLTYESVLSHSKPVVTIDRLCMRPDVRGVSPKGIQAVSSSLPHMASPWQTSWWACVPSTGACQAQGR